MSRLMAGILFCIAIAAYVPAAHAQFNILPTPRHVTQGQGAFELRDSDVIAAPADARAQWIAGFLRDALHEQTGVDLQVVPAPERGRISLRIDPAIRGDEAYRLVVTRRSVTISAADERGLFWGVQTLRQLLPLQQEVPTAIPAVSIEDAPRYAWRGVMLDTARHFYPVDFIKQQIDLMSFYKFDVFHWHLTDDQGWRIQIKRYPKLTSVGAWRKEADGSRYGGFYTQDQIREVVAYARDRNVMVVPEIEMPGHTSAAIAAYPELSCSGKPITVPATWGVFRDVDCVGRDSTFAFLENVLDEVIPLFPSPYVHIGGDEVPEGVWADCAACQQLAQANGLQGEAGLHSYFVRRIQTYLAGKGKALVGWDEIMEGGMNPQAVVEVWRGPDEAKKALANGNRIIIASPFYLDTPIDRMTLQDLYRTDPFDDPVLARHPELVLGGEAPLWSEGATALNGAARLYPRLFAIAEHLWSASAPDWPDFLLDARAQEGWLGARHVAYGPEDKDIVDYRLSFNPTYKRWRIRAARGFDALQLHYTTDGSEPTSASPSFGDVLDLYAPATVTVAPFRGDVQYQASQQFRMVQNLALGDPVTFATPTSAKYSADLTDGILGNDYDDGAWAGWQGADMDATIDLGQPTEMHSIDARFLQDAEALILLPQSVTFETSNDGKAWTPLQTVPITVDPEDMRTAVRDVTCTAQMPVTARYVRVVASRYGQQANGIDTWIFSDEIIVK
ncbi:MAG TPA: family 20 glycosylhydrolase [Rhodanobacteraceae bacterium]|jgi:hexosaminidase|nr:family 20 glycosylhydrolase [Rhodanobacteraceae bacterium]